MSKTRTSQDNTAAEDFVELLGLLEAAVPPGRRPASFGQALEAAERLFCSEYPGERGSSEWERARIEDVRLLSRVRKAAETLLESGIAPREDVAEWLLSAVVVEHRYELRAGMHEVVMACQLYKRFGTDLRLTDTPSRRRVGKVTDFVVQERWTVELKSLVQNIGGIAAHLEKAESQHAAMASRMSVGGSVRGITIIRLPYQLLGDVSPEAVDSIGDQITDLFDHGRLTATSAVYLIVDELVEEDRGFSADISAAVFIPEHASVRESVPRELADWVPEPARRKTSIETPEHPPAPQAVKRPSSSTGGGKARSRQRKQNKETARRRKARKARKKQRQRR